MPSSAPQPTYTYPLSLHDALPIFAHGHRPEQVGHLGQVEQGQGIVEGPGLPGDRGEARGRRQVGLDAGGELTLGEAGRVPADQCLRSEEHTSELQSPCNLVCRLLLPSPHTPTPFPYTTLFRSLPTGTGPSRSATSGRSSRVRASSRAPGSPVIVARRAAGGRWVSMRAASSRSAKPAGSQRTSA